MILSDLKSNFTLAGVENALRSHWTDDAIKRCDDDPRHHSHYQDEEDDISEPDMERDDAFFDDMTSQQVACYREAQQQEQEAWMQVQHTRRTLRDARARQHDVRMGRKFYKPSWQKGGSGGGGRSRSTPIGAAPSSGGNSCLKCGKNHQTSECPQRDTEHGLEAQELAEFTYYQAEVNSETRTMTINENHPIDPVRQIPAESTTLKLS